MPKSTSNADQCCTVRLPHGVRDQLVAATGQNFSTIVRFMCLELLKREKAKRALQTPKQELQTDIGELPSPPAG